MKMQDYFDKAYNGLKSQDFQRSYNEDRGSCVYYDEETKCRCAFGWVLSDEDIDFIVEHDFNTQTDYSNLPEEIKDKYPIEDCNNIAWFFHQLQGAHDSAYSKLSMKRNLEQFAERFGLKYPEE